MNHFFNIYDINCDEDFSIVPYGRYISKLEYFNNLNLKKFKRPYPDSNITINKIFDFKKEYEKFYNYINNANLIDKEIKDNLGVFLSFKYYCYGYYADEDSMQFKYYLVISIKKKENNCIEIDYDNDIALIYYKEKEECFLNIKNPHEIFKSRFEFKSKYYGMCLIKGLWKKNLN
jgi:hypothetical protein